MYDVIIIGAGPAGLFSALKLINTTKKINIAIVDRGKKLLQRRCNCITEGRCQKCSVCDVVHGVGGAGMYSDGKLSLFPAGSKMEKLFKNKIELVYRNKNVLNSIIKFSKSPYKKIDALQNTNLAVADQLKENHCELKMYSVYHLGTEGIQNACNNIEKKLVESGVQFILQNTVDEIKRKNGIFTLDLLDKNRNLHEIKATNVIIATGKASGLKIRTWYEALGVKYAFNPIELGVRVEADRDALKDVLNHHLDAKIKMKSKDYEIRTFCMCNGGYLARCYYDTFDNDQKICTISGFSYYGRKTDNLNFGLLVRKKYEENIDPIKKQISYIEKINLRAGNNTIVQRLEDFMDNRVTTSESLNKNSIESTLSNIVTDNIKEYFPDYTIEAIENFFYNMKEVFPKLYNKDTLLHAPVWEMCWDRIITKDGVSTEIPNLYVVGDITGSARGIIQAATLGEMAAEKLLADKYNTAVG
ncbi:NAD(P)/FAD-dependent oxidoreductase [Anaerosacchariphilus polymeriproducens]|uniref:Uncharacterized protein n=1 Tax=Anaerosacchariphilus polymeriproducens TaxID=1812858 RepID=A0A371AZH4_9FIRM|nr:FAD-dependent oxidoreductase [Anaerosacchariphilus polymeriproducens]RDU24961.1 hypothetical protein DWV06_01660 [Anaerosacchariphilus polymeriproducens]